MSKINKFAGINPHLNSHLQQPDGGWETFHARHISDIATLLDANLPANYYAVEEKSLQIHAVFEDTQDSINKSRTVPDVTVYQTDDADVQSSTAQNTSTPTLVFPVAETFDEEDDINAVIVYKVDEGNVPGTPITHIEVLCAGNKPGGAHHRNYLSKRQQTLKSGLSLIEIDYLHETRPIIKQIPSYNDGDASAYPYCIIVSTPYPTPDTGQTQVFGFRVDETLPIISVPLANGESIALNMDNIYQQTFASRRLFQMVVDYEQLPQNFETYSPDDQAKIKSKLHQISAERKDS